MKSLLLDILIIIGITMFGVCPVQVHGQFLLMMKSIAVKKYLTGNRPPSAACGEGSIPHSYGSNFARLYLFGPVMAAMATEKTAKPKPMAPMTRIGTYGFTLEV